MNTGSELKIFSGIPGEYRIWKIRIQDKLAEKKLWGSVTRTMSDKNTPEDKLSYQDDTLVARSIIRSHLADQVIDLVRENDTIPEIFARMDKKYAGVKGGPQVMWEEITGCKFTGGDIHGHVNKFDDFFRKLAEEGNTLNEKSRRDLLMQSLPNAFDDLRTTLITCNDLPSYDRFKEWVLEKATHIKAPPQVLKAIRHVDRRGPLKTRGQRSEKRCNFCRKPGHIKKDCWKLNPKLKQRKGQAKTKWVSKKAQKNKENQSLVMSLGQPTTHLSA